MVIFHSYVNVYHEGISIDLGVRKGSNGDPYSCNGVPIDLGVRKGSNGDPYSCTGVPFRKSYFGSIEPPLIHWGGPNGAGPCHGRILWHAEAAFWNVGTMESL